MALVSMQSYINGLVGYQNSGINQMSQLYDFSKTQKSMQSLVEELESARSKVTSLGSGSSAFLREYSAGMGRLSTEAGALAGYRADAMVTGRAGETTPARVDKAVDTTRSMLAEYNNSLKLVQDNAGRGRGVQAQRDRMMEAPTTAENMAKLGITQNDDGTLALDEEKLTAALSAENPDDRYGATSALGALAQGMRDDARAGMNTRSQSLVENDLAAMRSQRTEESEERSVFQSMRGSGAYGLSNMAAVGMLMNMMV